MCDTQVMTDDARSRPERRDAVANREKLLRTAADLFARRGLSVPLTEIADAAGVGVGTFYRRFPDRDALLGELQRRGLRLLLDTLDQITADGLRGADAIEAYLHACLGFSDQLIALPLRGGKPLTEAADLAARRRIERDLDGFLGQGRDDGTIGDAVKAPDVIVFSTLLGNPLPHAPNWKATARRQIRIFLHGIRPE